MRFKIDENLPGEAAESLTRAGHDAMSIPEQKLGGKPDPLVAAVCQSEGRTLITLDLDFSDIRAYPPSEYPGVIVLRPRTQAKQAVLGLLLRMIPLLSVEPLHGKLWIVHENGLRIRESM